MRLAVVLLVWLAVSLAGALAAAQPETETDLDKLLDQLEREDSALVTTDCEAACRALDAMRRITARICELDQGPPCERSRRKLEGANRRVEGSCGGCEPTPGGRKKAAEKERTSADEKNDDETLTAADTPTSPPASEERGGCASCTLGDRPTAPLHLLWLVAFFSAALRRRRSDHVWKNRGRR